MKRTLVVLLSVAALAIPVANAWATAKKRVTTVTKSVTSSMVDVSRWGQLELQVKVQITTTTVGKKKTKTWKVTSLSYPVYPEQVDALEGALTRAGAL